MTTAINLSDISTYRGRVATLSPLRVVHVTEAPLGGVLTYLQELLGVQADNIDIESIHCLVPEINAEPLQAVTRPNVHIRSFRHGRKSLLSLLRLAVAARHMVREVEPDIVHIHSTIAGVVVRLSLLTMRDRPKILYSPHGWFFVRPDNTLRNALSATVERLLARRTDRIVCVSDYEKRAAAAAGIADSKCIVVKSGIAELSPIPDDALQPNPDRSGRLRILFVGRFDHVKGFDVYLEVMRRLGETAEGIAVGRFIVNRAQPIAAPDNVRIIGWQPREELHQIYREVDVVLVPSRSEAFGLVAAEAMRAGTPVFASRVGSLPELVIDDVTGRLFEPGDVDQIVELLRSTSRSTLAEYGHRGRKRFREEFSSNRMNEDLLSHYRMMVKQDD